MECRKRAETLPIYHDLGWLRVCNGNLSHVLANLSKGSSRLANSCPASSAPRPGLNGRRESVSFHSTSIDNRPPHPPVCIEPGPRPSPTEAPPCSRAAWRGEHFTHFRTSLASSIVGQPLSCIDNSPSPPRAAEDLLWSPHALSSQFLDYDVPAPLVGRLAGGASHSGVFLAQPTVAAGAGARNKQNSLRLPGPSGIRREPPLFREGQVHSTPQLSGRRRHIAALTSSPRAITLAVLMGLSTNAASRTVAPRISHTRRLHGRRRRHRGILPVAAMRPIVHLVA